MTAYVLAAATNIDALSPARTGGDTVDTNGFKFTIDQDTRYGLGGGSTFSLGSMTINASKGGDIEINSTQVRQIPYNTGTGNVPAYNTTISQGGVSGKLIRVQSAINAAPTAVGAAMPATGVITVKQVSGGAYAAGALSGIGASATGADVAGFIELVGDESATINCNRLGTFRVRGEWYEVGTTSGSNATTYQLPTNGSVQYYPAVWVETGASTGVFEPYPCAGSLTAASSTATDAVRGKVCWATTGGVLRFGSDGTNTVGYVPPSGRRIRIPNILTANCTTAARGTNALPNATLGTRYDFTTTGGGVIDIDKMLLNWYPSFAQAYSVTMSDVGIAEQLSMSEVAQPMTLTRVAVGQSAAQAQFGLTMSLCFAGGTMSNCVWTSATLAASGRYIQSLTDLSGFTFNDCKDYSFVIRGNATTGAATLTRVANSTWNRQQIGLGQYLLTTCTNLAFNDTVYHDGIVATATTNPMSVWVAQTNSSGLTFNGLTFGGLTNAQPYTAILSIAAAGCSNIKLRNIGTSPSSQLSLGSANQTGTVCAIANGAAASDVKLQRIFTSSTRTNLYSGDNSSTRITVENCMGDYADVPVNNMLNLICKGVGAAPTYVAQTAVYGTHWWDHFTSATVGRIAIVMNEPTAATASQVTLSNGAAFTAAGGLYMPTIGMQVIFEMPYFSLGHSSFANSALVMAGGGAATNFTYQYQIDTGSGWSAWSSDKTATSLGTALNAESINPSTGFKLKLKITTSTTNTAAITSVYVITGTSAANQANYYPLDTNTVTFTGIPSGTDMVVLSAGTSTILQQTDSASSFSYTYSGAQTVDVGFIKPGYVPYYIRNLSLTTSDSSIPVSLTFDRNYA